MPEVAEPLLEVSTTQTEGFEMPEGLKNLLDRHLPMTEDKPPAELEPIADTPGAKEEKKEAPKEEKKAEPVKTEEKKPDLKSRLAPDLVVEKKPEPIVEPEIEVTEEMISSEKNPKKQASLRELGKALQHFKNENAKLKQRPEQVEDGDTKAILAQKEETIRQLTERVEKADLVQSPKFQQQFIQPRDKMFMDARQVLQEAGADPNALNHAFSLNVKGKIEALDELMENIPSQMLKDRFGRLIDGIDTKNKEIGDAVKNWQGNKQEWTRQEKLDQHQRFLETEKQLKANLQMAKRDLAENLGLEVLVKTGKPDFKWWDDQADEIDATAEEIMLRSTPDKLPIIAYFAAALGPTREMFHAERKARLAAEERLRDIEGAEPKLGEDKRATKPDVADDADYKGAILDRLKKLHS